MITTRWQNNIAVQLYHRLFPRHHKLFTRHPQRTRSAHREISTGVGVTHTSVLHVCWSLGRVSDNRPHLPPEHVMWDYDPAGWVSCRGAEFSCPQEDHVSPGEKST